MKQVLSFVVLLLTVQISLAQSVVRGPYLQSATTDGITIMWRTSTNTNSKVWYGTDPANLSSEVQLNNNVRDHSIELTGLQPYTFYYYAVGDDNGILAGNNNSHYFRTHPQIGEELPIRVWAVGDFGKGNAEQVAVKQSYLNYTGNTPTDVWIWLGDNAYDDGKDSEYQNKVFGLTGFSDVFNWIPFWPSPGNHDYNEVWSESTLLGIPYTDIPISQHEGPYFDIVDVPEQGEAGGLPSQTEVFYSFDYGNVHFLSLNSELFDFTFSYQNIEVMKDWIEADLQQNDKDFTIAYFHQPPYSKGSHDSDDFYELVMEAMRERVIPLLEEYDVDLVVCGHSHVFERSYLINGHYGGSNTFNYNDHIKDGSSGNINLGTPYIKDKFAANPEGTVYVVCGNSGSKRSSATLDHPVMFYGATGDTEVGSFVMDIYKNRLDGKYLHVDGSIKDEFTLLKKNMILEAVNDFDICEGETIEIDAVFSGGSDSIEYEWSPSPLNDASVELSPTQTTDYTLKVTDLLTGQEEIKTFSINVTPLPDPNIILTNDTLMVAPGYNYVWRLNGVIVPNIGNQHFLIPEDEGNYTVTISNGNCTKVSNPYTYYDFNILPIEDKEICEGESIDLVAGYSGGSGSYSFDWQPIASNDGIVTVTPLTNSNYTLTITDLTTNESQSTSFTIFVNDLIEPQITQVEDTLMVQEGYTYKWYKNGVIIVGANSYFYIPSESGNYSVQLTNGDCKSESEQFYFEVSPLSISNVDYNDLKIYPNPAKEKIIIEIEENLLNDSYIIYDNLGKKISTGVFKSLKTNIDLALFSAGVYFISIDTHQEKRVISFTKE